MGGWVGGASCLVKAGHKQPVFKCMKGMEGDKKKSVGCCVEEEDKGGGGRQGRSGEREAEVGGAGRNCAVRWAVCRGGR